MRFDSKVCVITGASSGIGRRTAVDLARAGALVCAVARREDRLRALIDDLGGTPHSYVVADVSDVVQIDALAEHVRATYGRCDVLINNAGIGGGGRFNAPDALGRLERTMAVNFFGAARCTNALLPLLLASAPSNVVNVASVAGRLAVSPAYSASKFALVGWSEALHHELKPKGVTVTVVEPGPVPTEGFPQADLVDHPLLRHSLTSAADVSRAIRRAIATGGVERMVPRWYYAFVLARVLAPRLYHATRNKVLAGRG